MIKDQTRNEYLQRYGTRNLNRNEELFYVSKVVDLSMFLELQLYPDLSYITLSTLLTLFLINTVDTCCNPYALFNEIVAFSCGSPVQTKEAETDIYLSLRIS